jgi:hypothetical protein
LDLLVRDSLLVRWQASLSNGLYETIVEKLVRREVSPWQAVEQLIEI